MSPTTIAAAAALVWLGMVVAISFMEAPLKFRAPGVTVKLGLGIGKIIFRALNTAEAVLAITILVSLALASDWRPDAMWLIIAVAILVIQLAIVRPILGRRSAKVLAGNTAGPRSRLHWVYVGLEAVKVVSLLAGGLLLLI